METSAKADFSSIARALLLSKANEDARKTVKVEIDEEEVGNPDIKSKPGRISDGVNGNNGQSLATAICMPVRVLEGCSAYPQSSSLCVIPRPLTPQGEVVIVRKSPELSICAGFYSRVCSLTTEMLSQRPPGSDVERPKYGPKGQALLARVRLFFEELRALLGPTCRGTIFDSPTALTAAACGVSKSTVIRLGNSLSEMSKFPVESPKKYYRSARQERIAALKNHGAKWGEPIRQILRRRMKEKADVSVSKLHKELKATYPDFTLSMMTIYRLMRALGFCYKQVKGKYYIYERPMDKTIADNLVYYLEQGSKDSGSDDEESEGAECDFHELMEEDFVAEPWVLESMDKDKDDESEPFYVFRPAKSAASDDGATEATGDQTNN